jgi:hypothetical protein
MSLATSCSHAIKILADLQVFSKVEGFEYLAITEPSTKKAFHRVAWAQFAEGVDVDEVVKKLDNSRVSQPFLIKQVRSTS